MEESKVVEMIKEHIEDMGQRQVVLNRQVHDINVELQTLLDERSQLESTLYKIEKAMEGE